MIDQHESPVRGGASGAAATGPGNRGERSDEGARVGNGPRERRSLNRRNFLLGSTVVVAAGGVAAVSRWLGSEDPAARTVPPSRISPDARPGAPGLRSLDDVLAEADATAGGRWLGSPWGTWFGGGPQAWSGIYVTWLLRENGITRSADVPTLYAELERAGRVGEDPEPGALIFYSRGEIRQAHRVGLVTSVTEGVAQSVEGDHPFTRPHEERFVRRFARPWEDRGRVGYAYPSYS